jgi:hypothetical protein
MSTNIPRNATYKHSGPVRLAFIDDTNDRAYVTSQVENFHIVEGDPALAMNKGILNRRDVALGVVETNYELNVSGMFVETQDPDALYLFLKNCGTPIKTDCSIQTVIEVYKAYRYAVIWLMHADGFFGTGVLPPITGLEGQDVPYAGSSVTPRNYHIFIVPYYGNTPGEQSSVIEVEVEADEGLLLNWDQVVGGQPTEFYIYTFNDGQTEDDALLRAIVDGGATSIFFWEELPNLGTYPGDSTGSFSVINDDTEEVYESGTDYIVDTTCGKIQIPEDTTIPDGANVRITYSWRANPSIQMSIGPAEYNPLYMHIQAAALHADDRNPASVEGVVVDFWKVAITRNWDWDVSARDFTAGFTFNWPVMYHEYSGNHGQITAYNKHNEGYEIIVPGTISQFHNQAPCGDES